MGRALEHQDRNPEVEALPFEDRLILLLQHEVAARQSHRLAQRLRWARLPQTACRQDYSVRYFQVPRLTDELLHAGAQQKKSAFFKLLAKADLLVLDDFGLTPLADPFKRDLLEIVDDRFDKKSTLITSQMPVEAWHAHLDDPTLADAILDRLVHNAYQIELKGESMRKRKPLERAAKA